MTDKALKVAEAADGEIRKSCTIWGYLGGVSKTDMTDPEAVIVKVMNADRKFECPYRRWKAEQRFAMCGSTVMVLKPILAMRSDEGERSGRVRVNPAAEQKRQIDSHAYIGSLL